MPHLFLADIGIPNASQCVALLGPVAALIGARWLLLNSNRIIRRLMPSQDWQQQPGWIEIAAERRVATVFRWLGYVVYASLAVALYGIVWGAESLRQLGQWSDPRVFGELILRLPVLATCLGLWLLYFGCELFPKLHREYEREELEKFRAEHTLKENEEQAAPHSRFFQTPPEIWTKTPYTPKPRSLR